MYRFRTLSVIFIAALILFSCKSSKKGDNVSSTTGWKYNDPDNGGFEVALGAEQKTGPGLVLIEGGRFTMGRVEQDVMFDWNNIPRTVTVSLSLIHISEPTRRTPISYAVFCLK